MPFIASDYMGNGAQILVEKLNQRGAKNTTTAHAVWTSPPEESTWIDE